MNIKSRYKKFERSTFDDFAKNYKKELNLNDFIISGIQLLVDRKEYSNYFQLRGAYSMRYLIIELSNMGFNENKTRAILYYGFIQGPMSAGGVYLVYEKKRSRWKCKKVSGAWAT